MHTGTVIDGKYEIVKPLGVGGFGAVYEALQLQFSRHAALKILSPTVLQEADGLARFEREAKAVNALRHKNIVTFLGYGVFDQAPYMVMELVRGVSLESVISTEKQIEPRRALLLIKQVFEGLACAHTAGVVHRDLKPTNIMVFEDATGTEAIKIIDFGLAKLMPGYGLSAQKLTETGYALGTCHYMAPEQALGQPVDQRADIYAAGCILYEMVTGKLPFDADQNIAVVFQHLNELATPVEELVTLSAQYKPIATVINKCMAKDTMQRYQKANDVISDVEAILENRAQELTRFIDTTPVVVNESKQRVKRLPIALVAALAVLTVAATGAVWWFHERRNRAEMESIQDVATEKLLRASQYRVLTPDAYQKVLKALQSKEFKRLSKYERAGVFYGLMIAPIELPERFNRAGLEERFARAYLQEVSGLDPDYNVRVGTQNALCCIGTQKALRGEQVAGPLNVRLRCYVAAARRKNLDGDQQRKNSALALNSWKAEGCPLALEMRESMDHLFRWSKDRDLALEYYQRLATVCPQDERDYYVLRAAQLNSQLGRHDRAIEAAKRIEEKNPSQTLAKRVLAETYLRASQHEAASRLYEQLAATGDANDVIDALCGVARIAAGRGRWDEVAKVSSSAEKAMATRFKTSSGVVIVPIGMRALAIESAHRTGRKSDEQRLRAQFIEHLARKYVSTDMFIEMDAAVAPNAFDWTQLRDYFPGGNYYSITIRQ